MLLSRQRLGDDLATVSRVLKIRKDHLEALEEDHFEQLPGRAYAIGFIRSYSDYLGLDPVQRASSASRAEIAWAAATPRFPPAGFRALPRNVDCRMAGW